MSSHFILVVVGYLLFHYKEHVRALSKEDLIKPHTHADVDRIGFSGVSTISSVQTVRSIESEFPSNLQHIPRLVRVDMDPFFFFFLVCKI